ncbi:hypothetical protein CNR22_12545 [Sphingobacteriaceae bacterium]|nr:hypothetical protein CNR22_12545 [Sphingobacteriaceae bacterium]
MKKLIYKLLEVIYRNGVQTVISGITVKLPFRFYRYYEKDYETDNVSFFKKTIKKNDVIFDIGAQIGLMTKLFSDLTGPGGKVFSFEPTPFTFSILQKTIALNSIGHIAKPVQAAVSDKKGKATFNVSDVDIDAANSLSAVQRDHTISGIEVDVTSVDTFVSENSIQKVNFLKIDAEGAEYFVLLGSAETLKKDRPIVNLALHPNALSNFNSSLQEIYDFVRAINYDILFKSKHMSKEEFCSQADLFDVQLLPKN